jgi:hypothetical protein
MSTKIFQTTWRLGLERERSDGCLCQTCGCKVKDKDCDQMSMATFKQECKHFSTKRLPAEITGLEHFVRQEEIICTDTELYLTDSLERVIPSRAQTIQGDCEAADPRGRPADADFGASVHM